jgi:antitoxin component of RelBE/YafQ-DinJ toxin-antitoxin module
VITFNKAYGAAPKSIMVAPESVDGGTGTAGARPPVETGSYQLTKPHTKVYTFGMSKYAVINLKTDPDLKKLAAKTADKLGISVSAVLNNELRRFAIEQSVVFDVPEAPNPQTQKRLKSSRAEIDKGQYHKFKNNKEALDFLANELR